MSENETYLIYKVIDWYTKKDSEGKIIQNFNPNKKFDLVLAMKLYRKNVRMSKKENLLLRRMIKKRNSIPPPPYDYKFDSEEKAISKFEEETGRHAIWNGKQTKAFLKWKETWNGQ